MIIVWTAAKSLAEYIDLKKEGLLADLERPRQCWCGEKDSYWSHGRYSRTVEEGNLKEEIEIQRYLCRECGGTASVLPAFVIPRRRYSKTVVACGAERYASESGTYRDGATRLGVDGPSPAQVFRWVAVLVDRVNELLLDVQAWCVAGGVVEDEMLKSEDSQCPNSWKARVSGKAQFLDDLAKLVSFGRRLRGWGTGNVMEYLGMRFLENAEQMQQIFAHEAGWLPTPQRMKP